MKPDLVIDANGDVVPTQKNVLPQSRRTIRNDGSRHTVGLAGEFMLDSTDVYWSRRL
jgi:hypothetical protein